MNAAELYLAKLQERHQQLVTAWKQFLTQATSGNLDQAIKHANELNKSLTLWQS